MRKRLICTAMAVAAAVSLSAQAPDRTKPPVPGPPPALKLPTIQKQQLSNGVPVWIVEQHEVPVAQVNLVVLSGSADDPTGKYGIANLAASMLMEGAGSRSSLEFADAIDFLGADLNAASASDLSTVRLHAPVARLADALPLMADVVQRPIFAQPDLDICLDDRFRIRVGNPIEAIGDGANLNAPEFRVDLLRGERPRERHRDQRQLAQISSCKVHSVPFRPTRTSTRGSP